MSRLTAIAAVAANGVIGNEGDMVWHLPEDFRHFKRTTMGHAMIMGRTTFEGLGALPGRRTVVVTRDPEFAPPQPERDATSVVVVHSLAEALEEVADEDAFVAGGAQIYEAFMPEVDRLVISEIPGEYEGDARFPTIDTAVWHEIERDPREGFTVVTYERRTP